MLSLVHLEFEDHIRFIEDHIVRWSWINAGGIRLLFSIRVVNLQSQGNGGPTIPYKPKPAPHRPHPKDERLILPVLSRFLILTGRGGDLPSSAAHN